MPADGDKLNTYLTNLGLFRLVTKVMRKSVEPPYSRAAVHLDALPKESKVELDGVMIVDAEDCNRL